MATQNTPIFAKRTALSVAGVNIAIMLAGSSLRIWFSVSLRQDWLRDVSFVPVAVVVYSVVGVLIISRYPRHTLGWLFLIVGFLLAMVSVLVLLQTLEPTSSFGPFLALIWWASHLAFLPAIVIPLSLMLLLFPDGRLQSRRWTPIAVAALLGICGGAASIAFYPWPWKELGIRDAHNPFAVAGSEGLLTRTVTLSYLLMAVGVLGSVAAVAVRFYRSQGIERLQMKWLVYTAVGGMSSVFLVAPLFGELNAYYLLVALPTLMAIAIGIAILRYRLWEIDLIIRRTLIYGLLTAVLALVYFSSVFIFQRLIPAQSEVAVVASTLAIAALFTPLRSRIQRAIDRRFYRQTYDAELILRSFGRRLRDEVDLDRISHALLSAAADTLQPTKLSLWLHEVGRDRR